MNSFLNKKTVIIGASGGIGRYLAISLSNSSQQMVLHGLSQNKLLEVKNEIIKTKGIDSSQIIDISYKFTSSFFTENEDNISSTKASLLEHVATADTLCVCYGPFLQKPLHQMTQEEWLYIASLVFALPGFLVSKALPHMMKQKYGRILLFGGTRTDEINSFKTNPAYGAGKTALSSLVKSISNEYKKYGIRCNAILPGFTETEYVSEIQKKYYKELLEEDEMISINSIINSAMFLLDSEDINGVLLKVDRGWQP